MSIALKLEIIKKQIKIYYRMQINYRKFVKNKTIYFYIFTLPIFGFFSFLIIKLILLINSKYLMKMLSHKIFLSSIRFLQPEEKIRISNFLPEYNDYHGKIHLNNSLGDKKLDLILKELTEDGITNLGVVFSKKDCENFINHLSNKICFNSQTQMQSNGIGYQFNINKEPFNNENNSYFCFDPAISLAFKPLKDFLENSDLIKVINNYLGFHSLIYFSSTWCNPTSSETHYVHRLHRDYDDFKFLVMNIYWNDINELNGPLEYVKKSHRNKDITKPSTLLIGSAGTVTITDNFGLHRGNQVKEKVRYITQIRFGQYFNSASVSNGFLS